MAVIKEKGLRELKILIITRGYSQEKLAEMLSMSKFSLNKKLNRKSQLTVAEVLMLVEILQIANPQEYFFGLDSEK